MSISQFEVPKISVVIPLYNKVRHIKRALDSVLSQTYQDFEVIVVNDGSTDGSEKVVQEYTDPRIRLINQENSGPGAARNRGIKEADNELIAFLDADDEYLPDFLKTVQGLFAKYPGCGAFGTAYIAANRNLRIRIGVKEPIWEGVLENYFRSFRNRRFCLSSVAVPKCVFKRVGDFYSGLDRGEDADIACRIALKYAIAYSTRAGAVIYGDAENKSRLRESIYDYSKVIAAIDYALASRDFRDSVRKSDLLGFRAMWYTNLILRSLKYKHISEARTYLRKAFPPGRYFLRWFIALLITYLPKPLIDMLIKIKEK
ncbi:glycosyltransferase family 2 protein [Candidatus Woesearchaeota archaeon]|nr:MAG: glycosyltransferase family 2 protein [Candidatus Woesearchaeota archaeon]